MSILVIVESPGKITKFSNILGKNYNVKASNGHIRNLDNKQMSIDFENNFEPIYVITKPDIVKNLRLSMKNIKMIYIASDCDREGEAIAQSILDILKPKQYKRLLFSSITKNVLMDSIKNAGYINNNLVDAQKARRVLDRLYGYSISPILQKQMGGNLSAGRVQSVTVKLIADKEEEINNFIEKNKDFTYFKVSGIFSNLKANLYQLKTHNKNYYKGISAKIELDDQNFKIMFFLKKCLKSKFFIYSITEKKTYRNPSPPFTTSTLQQEAARKLSMSIDITMKIAQKLYEGGYITYMRTDSVEISKEGHNNIKKVIENEYGIEYYQKNIYKSKVKNAQEAHECCRPTHPDLIDISKEINDPFQIKLYDLIWKRTIASQMKPAELNVMIIQISISKFIEKALEPYYYFETQIEKIIFPGFMKIYKESSDEENEELNDYTGHIPKVNDEVKMKTIIAKQEFMKSPSRYSQSSLVKKLEELGIGRPATYVNTIKTILDRNYIKIGNVEGIKKKIMIFTIKKNDKNIKSAICGNIASEQDSGAISSLGTHHTMSIFDEETNINIGQEKNKILITDLGKTVTNFLVQNFNEMMDYDFTAKIEKELDDISNGKKKWYDVVKKFYDRLLPKINELKDKCNINKDKLLGEDKDGIEIFASITRYGPVVKKKLGNKFVYAKIEEPNTINNITLKEANKLLIYPKLLGKYNKKDIFLHKGNYGFYLKYNNNNYAIENNKISLTESIDIIKNKDIKTFKITYKNKTTNVIILNGKFGPYIQVRGQNKKNYPIPKNININDLTEKKIKKIISGKKIFKNNNGSKTSKKVK